MAAVPHYESVAASERRRSPRFICGGRAQITCLPSDGIVLPGRLRNLGMGGCYIETASSLQLGARTEVLVQVNTLCFRAMSLVRAVRASSGVGIEFIRLSAGGHSTLAELIVDLERLQALLNATTITQKEFAENSSGLWLTPLEHRALLTDRLPVRGTILPPQSPREVSPVMNRCRSILEVHPASNVVDLFG